MDRLNMSLHCGKAYYVTFAIGQFDFNKDIECTLCTWKMNFVGDLTKSAMKN